MGGLASSENDLAFSTKLRQARAKKMGGTFAPGTSQKESPRHGFPWRGDGWEEESERQGVVSFRFRFVTLPGGVTSAGVAVVKVKSADRVTLPPRSTETTR